MIYFNKKIARLPKYYKEYLGDELLELADRCKLLYDVVSDKRFEYDVLCSDKLLFRIRHLINEIDI